MLKRVNLVLRILYRHNYTYIEFRCPRIMKVSRKGKGTILPDRHMRKTAHWHTTTEHDGAKIKVQDRWQIVGKNEVESRSIVGAPGRAMALVRKAIEKHGVAFLTEPPSVLCGRRRRHI